MQIHVLFIWSEKTSSRVICYEKCPAPDYTVATGHSVQLLYIFLLLLNRVGYQESKIQNDKCPELYSLHIFVCVL